MKLANVKGHATDEMVADSVSDVKIRMEMKQLIELPIWVGEGNLTMK